MPAKAHRLRFNCPRGSIQSPARFRGRADGLFAARRRGFNFAQAGAWTGTEAEGSRETLEKRASRRVWPPQGPVVPSAPHRRTRLVPSAPRRRMKGQGWASTGASTRRKPTRWATRPSPQIAASRGEGVDETNTHRSCKPLQTRCVTLKVPPRGIVVIGRRLDEKKKVFGTVDFFVERGLNIW